MAARQLWAFLTGKDVDELIAKIAAREPGLVVSRGRYLRGDPRLLLDDPEKLERRESLPGEKRIYLLHRKHSAEVVFAVADNNGEDRCLGSPGSGYIATGR